MAEHMPTSASMNTSPNRRSIKRASTLFQGGFTPAALGGADQEELSIENERLKTSLLILTQKLKAA